MVLYSYIICVGTWYNGTLVHMILVLTKLEEQESFVFFYLFLGRLNLRFYFV